MNTEERLKYVISEYVDVEPDKIDINMDLRFDIGLDSFGMISLICAIESEFGINIPDTMCAQFNTLADMVLYIEGRRMSFATI